MAAGKNELEAFVGNAVHFVLVGICWFLRQFHELWLLLIKIFTDNEGRLNMTNNLQPKIQGEKTTGLGLYNITQRYQFFTDDPVETRSESTSFHVSIPLINHSAINP